MAIHREPIGHSSRKGYSPQVDALRADSKGIESRAHMRHAPLANAGGNLATQRLLRETGGAHSRVSQPADVSEREAERVVDTLTGDAMSTRVAPTQANAQPRSPSRKGGETTAPANSGTGRPLDETVRSEFEPRLNQDLSRVSVHTDDEAARSARAYGARAYVSGSHIVFGAGEYAPETTAGRRLLAHELAHVDQQRRDPARSDGLIQRFESPEHIELGDTAGGAASGLIVLRCHDRDFPERTRPSGEWPKAWQDLHAVSTTQQRRAMTQGLTYGEVVALSGDMYADFSALNEAELKEVIRLIPLIHSKTATTEAFQAATGGRYLALAKLNESHFSNVPEGHRNVDVWRHTHSQAISAARERNANLAWGLNAAGDHFLTDAFSGGHIRTPRAALMGSALGNIESKILHDLDNTYGVEVTNPRGDPVWIAYGDNFLDDPRNAVSRAKALEAVQLSKQDVANALGAGSSYPDPSKNATFSAEALIPRPTDPSKDRWSGRIPTYMVGPDGAMRRPDDYTAMRDKVILSEGPGVMKGIFTDDDEIRSWVSSADIGPLGRQPPEEKIRMLNTLIDGVVTEDDMVAMEKLLRSVASSQEMDRIRAAMRPREIAFSDLGQRTRFRVALARHL
jgi:hypothetical protein